MNNVAYHSEEKQFLEKRIVSSYSRYLRTEDYELKKSIQESIDIREKLISSIERGTIKEVVNSDNYGELWEEWMIVKGYSQDV